MNRGTTGAIVAHFYLPELSSPLTGLCVAQGALNSDSTPIREGAQLTLLHLPEQLTILLGGKTGSFPAQLMNGQLHREAGEGLARLLPGIDCQCCRRIPALCRAW